MADTDLNITGSVYAVLGPTASGKSDLALRLALAKNADLVVCDAVMVYRGFDIGSNKPSAQEQQRVPHHGLDLCEAQGEMNAGRFAATLRPVVDQALERGRSVVLVVGTFLYYRALAYGLGPLPPSSPELRARFEQRERGEPGWLAAEVQRVDLESYKEAHGKNLPRLVRALEVFELTGKPASVWRQEHGGFHHPRWPLQRYLLAPERGALQALIEQRTQQMLQRGWVAEVERLRESGVSPDARPMTAIGYKQVNQFLNGELGPAELAPAIAIATRQYARRQRNFFAHEPDVRVLSQRGGDVSLDDL